jgi:osmoprotectant transport system permease protein
VYQYVKDQFESQYGLTWLRPIGFNNAYALMMRRQQARELGLNSISDLKDYLSREQP